MGMPKFLGRQVAPSFLSVGMAVFECWNRADASAYMDRGLLDQPFTRRGAPDRGDLPEARPQTAALM